MAVLLLLAAFEYANWTMPAAATLAGVAGHNWRLAASSPARSVAAPRFGVCAAYSRPFGLDGVDCGRVALAGLLGRVGLAGLVQSLHFSGYSESEVSVCAGTAARGFAVGTGLHLFLLNDAGAGATAVPGFDIGVRWSAERFGVGFDALRFNSPFLGGAELPARLVLSADWHPAQEFALAAEVSREQGDEDFAAACEFRPLPAAGIRAGVGVAPLRYTAGVGMALNGYGVDYCYELNPALGSTHSIQLTAEWR